MIDPKTIKNKALVAWVDNWAAHTTPDSVVWCDGSKEEADKLFDQIVDRNRPIRVVGYDMAELENDENEQYDMFTNIDDVKREKKLVQSILQLQEKYGKNTILKAYDLDEKATIRERNSQIGGHKSGES